MSGGCADCEERGRRGGREGAHGQASARHRPCPRSWQLPLELSCQGRPSLHPQRQMRGLSSWGHSTRRLKTPRTGWSARALPPDRVTSDLSEPAYLPESSLLQGLGSKQSSSSGCPIGVLSKGLPLHLSVMGFSVS